jgi:hypothetical protein
VEGFWEVGVEENFDNFWDQGLILLQALDDSLGEVAGGLAKGGFLGKTALLTG